jgi:hypothetical protein
MPFKKDSPRRFQFDENDALHPGEEMTLNLSIFSSVEDPKPFRTFLRR